MKSPSECGQIKREKQWGTARYALVLAAGALLLMVASPRLAFAQDTVAPQLTVVYSFVGGNDGASPGAGIVFDAAGNMYGTTELGGLGFGTVYKIDTTGKETVLYRFKAARDGFLPVAPLLVGSDGNFYGTTYDGGAYGGGCVSKYGCGTVFRVDQTGRRRFSIASKGILTARLPGLDWCMTARAISTVPPSMVGPVAAPAKERCSD